MEQTSQSPDSMLRLNFTPEVSLSASCCSVRGLQWPILRCHMCASTLVRKISCWVCGPSKFTSSSIILTLYIRGTLVEMGKVSVPWRRTGGVERRLHFTPFSASAPTKKMLAPRPRTSRTSNATGMTSS